MTSIRGRLAAGAALTGILCAQHVPAQIGEAATMDADLYVATNGSDAWSGRLRAPNATRTDGPLASLARARDMVRELPVRDRDVTVLIRGGTYRLTQPVVFTRADSATAGHTIRYTACPGEKPVFSAGIPVTDWQPCDEPLPGLPQQAHGRVWVADVSGHPAMRETPDGRSPRFFSLYDGDRALPRARGQGFSQVNATPPGSRNFDTVQFREGAVPTLANPSDAELLVIPCRFWVMNVLPIASIDRAACSLTTAQPATYGIGRNGMTDRPAAWIENALELLDAPGEWVLDSTRKRLYLWPASGQRPSSGIVAPALTELIRVEGTIDYDGPADQPVTGLEFRGLTFCHGERYPWHGRTGWGLQHDWELFDKPTALVRFRGAARCAVVDCEFRTSAHSGLRLDLHAQRNRITGNHFHHLGGVAVLLAGYGPGTKDVNKDNEVSNNYIHHIGRVYWGSSAVWAWQSGENRIMHNHIHSVPYTGILVTGRIVRGKPGPGECSRTVRWHEVPEAYSKLSWQQREPYLHARRNLVAYNDIHNAMEVLGDGNCIYVSGCGDGNVVRGNYCHHCSGKYMNAVIRCDDDQHGTLMTHNICYRTAGHAEGFISKGDNDIINNVVADLRPSHMHRGYVVFPYGSIKGSEIKRNILYSTQRGQVLYWEGIAKGATTAPRLADADMGANLYFCTRDPDWAGRHLSKRNARAIDEGSRNADPGFTDPAGGDFRFGPESPAAQLGIAPLDAAAAGLEPEYHRRLIGRRITTSIRPDGGELRAPVTVQIEADAPAAEIRFTLDGSEPTTHAAVYTGPFTLSRPGVVRARAFSATGKDWLGARAEFAAPPQPIEEDFEDVPVGAPAPGATTSEDAKRTECRARVTDDCAATGTRCLRFTDGPGQKHSFDPHVYYRTRFEQGTVRGSFAVRIDKASTLSYQWRQYDNGFCRGPAVIIQPGGKVIHEGQELLTIPTEKWVRFDVQCLLGDDADGRFTMRVWLPGTDRPRIFERLPCTEGFERLDWVGFVANGQKRATFYVDSVNVGPVSEP